MIPVDYMLGVATVIGINAILALSLNLLVGFAGQISIGHAAFVSVGAYAGAMLSTRLGLPFEVSLPVAALAAAGVGMLLGLPSLRLAGDFLAVTTIGVNFVVEAFFAYTRFFGGAQGIGGIPSPALAGVKLSPVGVAGVTWALVVVVAVAMAWLMRTYIGLGFLAVREDPVGAAASGVNVNQMKVLAFTVSTAAAGLGGALYAHYITVITPPDFGFLRSVEIFTFAALGGLATIRGPILGAVVLGVSLEAFRFLQEYRLMLYGLLLIIIMYFQPSGLFGDRSFLWTRIRRLIPRRRAAVAEVGG